MLQIYGEVFRVKNRFLILKTGLPNPAMFKGFAVFFRGKAEEIGLTARGRIGYTTVYSIQTFPGKYGAEFGRVFEIGEGVFVSGNQECMGFF